MWFGFLALDVAESYPAQPRLNVTQSCTATNHGHSGSLSPNQHLIQLALGYSCFTQVYLAVSILGPYVLLAWFAQNVVKCTRISQGPSFGTLTAERDSKPVCNTSSLDWPFSIFWCLMNHILSLAMPRLAELVPFYLQSSPKWYSLLVI